MKVNPEVGAEQALANLKLLIGSESSRRVVAMLAIKEQGGNDTSAEVLAELADILREHIEGLLAWLESDNHLFIILEKDGALRFDTIGLEYLEHLDHIGPTGKLAAEELRPEIRASWKAVASAPIPDESRLWNWWCAAGEVGTPFAVILARVLWQDVMREEAPQDAPPTTATTSPSKAEANPVPEDVPKFPMLSAVVLRLIVRALFTKNTKLVVVGGETRLVSRLGRVPRRGVARRCR